MRAIHHIDLGPRIEPEDLKALIRANWESELVRGIMQTISDAAFEAISVAKEGIKERNDQWIYAQLGRQDACESIIQTFDDIANSKAEPTAS